MGSDERGPWDALGGGLVAGGGLQGERGGGVGLDEEPAALRFWASFAASVTYRKRFYLVRCPFKRFLVHHQVFQTPTREFTCRDLKSMAPGPTQIRFGVHVGPPGPTHIRFEIHSGPRR